MITLKRVVRAVAVAILLAALVLSRDARPSAQSAPACALDLRILVMSADGTEADLPAIRAALDYLGTPYDTYLASDHPAGLDPSVLSSGCHGKYQGVILATDNLVHLAGGDYAPALSSDDAATLAAYETAFSVRQVTWYTFPTEALGFNSPDGASGDDRAATLTARGAQVFSYLTPGASIPIRFSWTYLATPFDASTVPLLTDASGHALAAIHTYTDGRENLAMTFDSNPYVMHSMLLSYGIVNWVSKGLFVGDRHVYVSPQVDDVFIDDALWRETTACSTSVDATGFNQRITGDDLTAVSNWQRLRRMQPQTGDLRVTMAFNGIGTTSTYHLDLVGGNDTLIDPSSGTPIDPATDTLTPTAKTLQQDFWWVSHTYTHQNLDQVPLDQVDGEIQNNADLAASFPLTGFVPHSLVQPDVSGLGNDDFLLKALAHRIQFLVSDTSQPGQDNPSPNVGFVDALEPGVFVIPRRANNLFFNVATPTEWAAEYNCHYRSYWMRDLSPQDILDVESDQLLAHLLRGELDPWMFHQTNLAAYDGTHTLLTDLLDATLNKYSAYVNLPVLSPSMDTLGARMAARTAIRQNGITATLQYGATSGVMLTSPVDVTVSVTGLELPGAEHYGGQAISWVPLTRNAPTLAAYSVVDRPSVSAATPVTAISGTPVALAGSATDPNSPPRPLTYAWMQTSGPPVTLTGANSMAPAFTAPPLPPGSAPATLTFTLTVNNTVSSTSVDTHIVVDPPIGAPVVTLLSGVQQTVESGASPVTLIGNVSDPNSPALGLLVTHTWVQTAGPPVALSDPAETTVIFSAPALAPSDSPVTLAFTLVAGNGVLTGGATTTVVVRPPIASLGASQTVSADGPGDQTTAPFAVAAGNLIVAFVSSDGPIDGPQSLMVSGAGLAWTNVRRANAQRGSSEIWTAIATQNLADAAVTASQGQPSLEGQPAYYSSLTAMTFPNARGTGASSEAGGIAGGADILLTPTSSGSLILAVGNDANVISPRVVPGDQVVVHDTTSALGDSHWIQGLGAGELVAAGVPVELNENPPGAGAWNFAAVEIVNGAAPVVDAGPPQHALAGTAVALSGHANDGSSNPPRPLTYSWSQTSGTPVTLTGGSSLTPAFQAPVIAAGNPPASLGFTLIASNGVLQSLATTTVEVDPPIAAPTVFAGADKIVPAGAAVALAGTVRDLNVPPLPATSVWAQTAGPAVSLADYTTLSPSFTAPALVVGMPSVILEFTLTSSNGFLSASSKVKVEVDPPIGPPLLGPIAPQSVAGGINVTLQAPASDPNVPALGLTYGWVQTSGPVVVMTDTTARNVAFIAPVLAQGDSPVTLAFSVTVSNGTLSTTAPATVTVQPPGALTPGPTLFSDGSGARTTPSFSANAGDLIVALVSAQGPSGGTQTATVTGGGLTWTLVRRSNSQRGTSEIWSAIAPAAAPAMTVTATLSSSNNTASLAVMTFAGSSGTGASAAASASSGAPTVSMTTTRVRSRVFAVGNDGTAAQNRTPASGQSVFHQSLGGADAHWMQTLTAGEVAAAGTVVQMRDTAPTADRWNNGEVEVLASRPTVISAARATTVGTAAVVNWTTDVPTTSRVDYGTSPNALTLSVTGGALVTSHALSLYGLTPGALYYYRVTSVDAAWTPAISPAPPAAPLTFTAVTPAGLVAAYSFSEGAGSTVADLTGNRNDGVISGAAWTASGRYGEALSFDGLSNWITVNDAPSLALTTNMTIEAWINPASLNGWQSVLYKESPETSGLAWSLYSSDSTAPPAVYAAIAGSSNPWTHATGTSMVPLNAWSHLAGTFDGASLRLYVNGTLARTVVLPGSLTVSSGPLRIGGNQPSIPYGGQFFKGIIDEVRIYNRTLTQSEIQADMNGRLP